MKTRGTASQPRHNVHKSRLNAHISAWLPLTHPLLIFFDRSPKGKAILRWRGAWEEEEEEEEGAGVGYANDLEERRRRCVPSVVTVLYA